MMHCARLRGLDDDSGGVRLRATGARTTAERIEEDDEMEMRSRVDQQDTKQYLVEAIRKRWEDQERPGS